MNEKEKLIEILDRIREIEKEERLKYEAENDEWWNNLTEKEREDAFYAVCKRIYEGDIKSKGSYRYVLYDVFGFDMGMYSRGMDCGYLDIHNKMITGDSNYDNWTVT